MTVALSKYFKEHFVLDITNRHIGEIEAIMVDFETKNDHPLALNSQLMGVHRLVLDYRTQNEIAQVFDIDLRDIRNAVAKEILIPDPISKEPIRLIPKEHKVRKDPLNLLVVWVIYCTNKSRKLPNRQKEKMMFNMMKLLIYKFYTSLLRRRFPHNANEAVMKATINTLDNKSDIVKYGTWRKVIEAQAARVVSRDYIYKGAFDSFSPDEYVLRVLSGNQTTIRNKVNHLYTVFKDVKDSGDMLGSYGTVGELEGVKVMLNKVSKYDSMMTNLSNEVVNINAFLNQSQITGICTFFKSVSKNNLNLLLTRFSELASIQKKNGSSQDIKKIGGKELFVGYEILVDNIVVRSYRFCEKKKIKFTNHVHILDQIKNIYSSSRISDEGIQQVKESVSHMVDEMKVSTRDVTKSSLKIAFILYIISKTFKYVARQ